MSKVKIAYRGKILKRSLLTPPVVVERMEYPTMMAEEEELVSYITATIILHGNIESIEKPIGTKLWYRSCN